MIEDAKAWFLKLQWTSQHNIQSISSSFLRMSNYSPLMINLLLGLSETKGSFFNKDSIFLEMPIKTGYGSMEKMRTEKEQPSESIKQRIR